MEEYRIYRKLLCIDLKSFYAAVECALLGLDPFKTPLVVADEKRGGGSIVLAVTPYLKQLGIPSRCRIYELPTNLDIIFIKPKMELYLKYSVMITEIYLSFIAEQDLYTYSIDESFLDVTSYLSYYKLTAFELAQKILKTIYEKTALFAACGIGPNMLIAKLALDLEAKNAPGFIAKWTYEDIPKKLWPITPISKMWGIGSRTELKLNRLGLHKIGDIANYNVTTLKSLFGIIGEELFYHSHGLDMSLIQDSTKNRARRKSFGSGQTLFIDYFPPAIFQLMTEMIDDIARRLRLSKMTARTIHLSLGYSKQVGGGFSRQTTVERATQNVSLIYQSCCLLFQKYYENEPIRRIQISVSNLEKAKNYQFSLFENAQDIICEQNLLTTIDNIKFRYGKNSLNRASSELKSSTIKARNKMIGGHNA